MTHFYEWLTDAEETLRQMIRGVFCFIFLWLPEWVYRTSVDKLGPMAVKMARVALAFTVWLVVVFGPMLVLIRIGLPTWGTIWLLLAIGGSAWGYAYLAKKRKGTASTFVKT